MYYIGKRYTHLITFQHRIHVRTDCLLPLPIHGGLPKTLVYLKVRTHQLWMSTGVSSVCDSHSLGAQSSTRSAGIYVSLEMRSSGHTPDIWNIMVCYSVNMHTPYVVWLRYWCYGCKNSLSINRLRVHRVTNFEVVSVIHFGALPSFSPCSSYSSSLSRKLYSLSRGLRVTLFPVLPFPSSVPPELQRTDTNK